MVKKIILVIAGPTGVGESTITKEIIKRHPIFKRLVTATTRKARPNEKNGVAYYFFTEKKFKEKIKKGNILEFQNTRNGIYYGSYKPDLKKKISLGYNIIINPDIIGAKYYKKHYNATTIFVTPDSIYNLKKRLLKRNPKISNERLKKRLKYAEYEIKNESPFYDYIVKNKENKLDEAINEVSNIIQKEGYRLNK